MINHEPSKLMSKLANSKLFRSLSYRIYPDYFVKESIHHSLIVLLSQYGKLFADKKLLDYGCGSMPYKSLFNRCESYTGIDFHKHTQYVFGKSCPDIFFHDNYKNSFKASNIKKESFDIFISIEVLEHHPEPEIFFSEANRILKKRGLLLLTVPFFWPLHEIPNDYQRLTEYKLKLLGEKNGFRALKVIRRGNSVSTLMQLYNSVALSAPTKYLSVFLLIPIMPIQLLFGLFKSFLHTKNGNIFIGYTILFMKNAEK